jgi:hypothetical protein
MVAVCLLTELGSSMEDATAAVDKAGSGPETPGQHDLVEWFAQGREKAR